MTEKFFGSKGDARSYNRHLRGSSYQEKKGSKKWANKVQKGLHVRNMKTFCREVVITANADIDALLDMGMPAQANAGYWLS